MTLNMVKDTRPALLPAPDYRPGLELYNVLLNLIKGQADDGIPLYGREVADWLAQLTEYDAHRDPAWDPFTVKAGLVE